MDLDKLFDLLIIARNSRDEEALQEAIDMVAIACGERDNVPTQEECRAMALKQLAANR